jgi:molybdate transport system substrate-binding protein
MKLKSILFSIGLSLASVQVLAEELMIAAAADLKYAMVDLVAAFKQQHPHLKVEVISGSSGKFYHQISHNAPFDMYFSADIDYPRRLHADGFTASEVTLYAIGRIVVWQANSAGELPTLNSLLAPDVAKIAIANPKHAPYGKRAQEALQATGLWEKIEDKLVYGENIAQTAQFIYSGSAQIGIIALALAVVPEMQEKGRYSLIDDSLHAPLEQGYVVLKRAQNKPAAHAFAAYLKTAPARAVFQQYGFVLPQE